MDIKTVDGVAEEIVLELVTDKLLGWKSEDDGWVLPEVGFRCLWNPYASKDDAWVIIDALNGRGWLTCVKSMPEGHRFILGNCAVTDKKLDKRFVCELYWMGRAGEVSKKRLVRRPEATWADTVEKAILNAALLVIAIEEAESLAQVQS